MASEFRELRKRAGLTQAVLAAKCGKTIEMQRVGEIERGERNCTLQTIERLAKGLKVEPAELFLFKPTQVGRSMSVPTENPVLIDSQGLRRLTLPSPVAYDSASLGPI